MIPIDKPEEEPERLQADGEEERAPLKEAFEDDSVNLGVFVAGRGFDLRIFSRPTVRKHLLGCHREKCCYCEKGREHVHEVEHFRPKSAVRQGRGDSNSRPGYYWLAYEWTTLFLCCPLCNRRHKNNLFPLRNPEDRAASHRDGIGEEDPLFLHPGRNDPEEHNGFREAIAYAKDGFARGRRTIEALRFNRDALVEVRRDYRATAFKEVRELLRMLDSGNLTSDEETRARRLLRRLIEQKRETARRDDKQFAAMLRDAVEKFEAKMPEG